MPRTRKPPKPTGLPYGDRLILEEADSLIEASKGGQPPIPAQPAAPQGPEQAAPGRTLLDAARLGPTPGPPLMRPSERPNEPVTAGVAAGPGPNMVEPAGRSNTVEFYERLASASGDPYFMHLANIARQRG